MNKIRMLFVGPGMLEKTFDDGILIELKREGNIREANLKLNGYKVRLIGDEDYTHAEVFYSQGEDITEIQNFLIKKGYSII